MQATVTGVFSACGGTVSTISAPRQAASSINGAPTRNTYQKLFANDFTVQISASPQVADGARLIGQAAVTRFGDWRAPIIGTNTKIKTSVVASFNATTAGE